MTTTEQTTKGSERNAFDVALQYATGIKIGGWRDAAMAARDIGLVEYRPRMHFESSSGKVKAGMETDSMFDVTGDDGAWADCPWPAVLIEADGAVHLFDTPREAEIEVKGGAFAIMPLDTWDEAKAHDARLHRKPTWRERAKAGLPLLGEDMRDKMRDMGEGLMTPHPPLADGAGTEVTE